MRHTKIVATIGPATSGESAIRGLIAAGVDVCRLNAVTIKVTGIFQDEPTNTEGDGNTSSDATGVGTANPQVRAERAGTNKVPGNGRVYHIRFTASDSAGGSCSGEVKVGVPHDQGGKSTPVDGGMLYNSVTGVKLP